MDAQVCVVVVGEHIREHRPFHTRRVTLRCRLRRGIEFRWSAYSIYQRATDFWRPCYDAGVSWRNLLLNGSDLVRFGLYHVRSTGRSCHQFLGRDDWPLDHCGSVAGNQPICLSAVSTVEILDRDLWRFRDELAFERNENSSSLHTNWARDLRGFFLDRVFLRLFLCAMVPGTDGCLSV